MDQGDHSPTLDPDTLPIPAHFRLAKDLICNNVRKLVTGAFGDRLRALILTGSLARDEATVVEENGASKLLGDAEFLLVFAEGAALPAGGTVRHLAEEIEGFLKQRGVQCSIDLAAVHPEYLMRLKPHIFAYELRTCGAAVWGDHQILSLIPEFSSADIPFEDAWRLLSNRIIEQLEVAAELFTRPDELPPNVQYRTVKLYQDMATSFLVFAGAYEPTYRGRAERLSALAADAQTADGGPFALSEFSRRVSACTNFKLRANRDDLISGTGDRAFGMTFWHEAVTHARLLWRWELARLSGNRLDALSDQQLLKAWMKIQPMQDRARGWAHVLRKSGWHHSWRAWPRWLRLGWQASPRYCVYAAASDLFFQLPAVLGCAAPPDAGEDWGELSSWLPLHDQSLKPMDAGWDEVAAEIIVNYKQFLTDTRA